MGANCLCSSRDTYFKMFNSFWSGIKIKNRTAFLYNDIVIELFSQKIFNMKKEVYEQSLKKYYNEFFYNDMYPELSYKFFQDILEYKATNIIEILIGIMFLSYLDKSSVKISFKKLCRYYKVEQINFIQNYEYLSKKTKKVEILKNAQFIHKSFLRDILENYFNIVSLFSIDYVTLTIKENQKIEDFKFQMKEEFCEDNIKNFVNTLVDVNNDSDYILIDEFFDDNYSILSDDSKVRNGISFFHYRKTNNDITINKNKLESSITKTSNLEENSTIIKI